MSDVNETLQELMERRLREMGKRRGRGESISLREAWQRLPEDENGGRRPTYEVFRRIRQDGHSNIADETADALATMLDVPVDQVLQAAGQRPRLGRFELPRRADRLTQPERSAVLGVVDAILEAADRDDRIKVVGLGSVGNSTIRSDFFHGKGSIELTLDEALELVRGQGPVANELEAIAARRGVPALRRARQRHDAAGEAPDPEGPEGGA